MVRADAEKLVTDPGAPLCDGAIGGKLGRYLTKGKGYYEHLLRTVAREHDVDLTAPFESLRYWCFSWSQIIVDKPLRSNGRMNPSWRG